MVDEPEEPEEPEESLPEELEEELEDDEELLVDEEFVVVVAALALKAARVLVEESLLLCRMLVDFRRGEGQKSLMMNLHIDCHDHSFRTMTFLCAVKPDRLRVVDLDGEDGYLGSIR